LFTKRTSKEKGRGRRGNYVSLQKLFTKRTSKEKEGVVGETTFPYYKN
jgi:hypothetical protein